MRPRKPSVALSATISLLVGVLLISLASRLKAAPEFGLQFDGLDDRVTFGAAPALGAQNFTLELWFMRQGSGVTTSSGTGGVTAVPLITKGTAEVEGSNKDMNYFLGIEPTTRVLTADFEDMNNGLNHPVKGKTAICDNVWYHAAATYDSTTGTWRLYLNGELEVEQIVTGTAAVRTPRFDSIQHAGLGTAMTSAGVAGGFFKGMMDEVRIWNVARSQADIQATMGVPVSSAATNLIGRWGLDDGAGTTALNSIPGSPNGSLLPLSAPPNPAGPPVWVAGGSGYATTPLPAGNVGLHFTGTTVAGDYVALEKGPYPLTSTTLGAANFTVETWFKREAVGVPISTGTGGLASMVPLVTKGRGEAEGTNVDFNYFLGLNTAAANTVIAADFEEGAAGAIPGQNHPLSGTTPIATGTWYHAAMTYDGTTLSLYLNGNFEGSVAVGQPARFDSIQPAALGSALNSTGVSAGFFAGTLDETRIWNYARTGTQIDGGRAREITNADGLLGRWGYNERCGCIIDSSGHQPNGNLLGASWAWVSTPALTGAVNMAPTVDAGADQAVTLPALASLHGTVLDDGVNTGVPLSTQWSKLSGPGTAAFTSPNTADTGVSVSATGTYVLKLTVSDGDYTVSDVVTVTASGVPNQAPVVDAGADQTITLPADAVSLVGVATDDGGPSPMTVQWTKVSGPGSVTFAAATAASTSASFGSEGTYVLRLTASDGVLSSNDTLSVTVNGNVSNRALQFGGTNAFVTLGPAPHLGASTFTIETWMRRDGAGIATFTGTGGVTAIPLVTKGMAETDDVNNKDMNYFLGLDSATGKLAADFEDTATAGNHPVTGVATLSADGRWHHVAATYDGTTWRLYVDGALDKTLVVGAFTPRFDSIQHAAIGTALNSTGGVGTQTQGFFNGALDEVRIWNYARSAAQIASGANREIPTASGLLGRWGLNEGAGTVAGESSGGAVTGTVVGTNFSWVSGAHVTGGINAAPAVDAGTDQTVTLPNVTMLVGSATDDSLSGTAVTTQWTQISGPGTALFANAASSVTTVDFTALGTYVLRITANDGELSAFDEVQVTVGGVINQPPVVDAGADQAITLPNNVVSLSGTTTDDGVLPGGPVTTQWSKVSGPGTVTFTAATALATNATFTLPGAYVIRLSATDGVLSGSDTLAVTVAPNPANKGLQLGGTNAFVTLGPAPGLGAAKFTIETWFRRDGAGVATFTGTGGITAIPLVTKGMAEVDNSDNRDMNYFLGIRQTDGVLIADFEDMATGGNHPIAGATAIPADGAWRHAAATYDGTTWRLYLDGVQDAQLVVGNFTPRFDSIQHAALGGALNSTGGVGGQPQGFFNGALDESRIWNYARSPQQISNGRKIEITVPVAGLLGRWGFNDGIGTTVADSAGSGRNGTIVGSAFSWVSGAPFTAPGNRAPVATDDDVTTNEDTAAIVSVLANDTDADADALTITTVGGPAHGVAVPNLANGTVSYTPAANFNGTDSFTYAVSDSQGGSATATVNVTVSSVNDAPVVADDSASTNEDTPVTIPVLVNDTDADGGTLTPVIVTGPANGTVTVEAGGGITYTPAANFNGSDSFTYKVNDGTGDSNVATVSVTIQAVNDVPTAVADSYAVDEDAMLVIPAPGVLDNDVDADGDSLSVTIASDVSHGSLTLNADGSIIYTPNENFNGVDSFTYHANDGTADSADVTVTLTVNSVNDAPVAASDVYTTSEDTVLTVPAAGVLTNDVDADGDTLQAALVSGTTNGTLTLNADGSFGYTPNANFNGSDSFSYKASDASSDSNVVTVSITVDAVNDPPAGVADHYTTDEDNTLTIAAPGVLANDTDVEGNALTAVLVSGPAHGTLTPNPDGGFVYVPAADFNGTDSFTYKASDDTELSAETTVTITVNAVNDAPVVADDTFSTDEDTVLTFAAPGVLANDTDVDSSLTAVVVSGTTHGSLTLAADGSFVYTPNANFYGIDSFSYKATDGTLSTEAHVTITVNSVVDLPVANDDALSTPEDTVLTLSSPGVLGNDVDGDGDPLSAVLVSGPSHGTLTLNSGGGLTYTPAAQYNGPDSFTYRAASATSDSNVATVAITVSSVADRPVAVNNSYTKNEDAALVVAAPGVLANDRDDDGDPLTAVLVTGAAHGTVVLNPNGGFTYTAVANYSGSDSFTYRASDGTLTSDPATVTISVTAVDDAPVANNDSYTTSEDVTLTVAAPGLLANDTDVDSPTLTAAKVGNPSHGTVTVNSNGSFTYTPNANYNGPDSFTYRARDASSNSNVATVTLTVVSVPDAPVANSQSASLSEDGSKAVTLTATDADSTTLTFSIVTGPAHGTLTGSAPNVTYVPAANYNGTDSFTFRASDGSLSSVPATVSLTITAVNDAPVAVANSYSTNEDVTLTVNAPGLLANDTDVEGSALTATKVGNTSHGTVTVNSNGSFTYVPTANYSGPDSFTYRVNDGSLNSGTATVTLTVTAVNDAPTAVAQAISLNQDSTRAIMLTGSDVENSPLTFTIVTAPAHGVLTGTAPNVTYRPAVNYHGTDSFTFRVSDGSLNSAPATVSLTVVAVNNAPVAQSASFTTPKEMPRIGQLVATDSDHQALTYSVTTQPTKGLLFFDPSSGWYLYLPLPGKTGADSFKFRASDGTTYSNIATISIQIH